MADRGDGEAIERLMDVKGMGVIDDANEEE